MAAFPTKFPTFVRGAGRQKNVNVRKPYAGFELSTDLCRFLTIFQLFLLLQDRGVGEKPPPSAYRLVMGSIEAG